VALASLVERLRERGFTLLDTQWVTPHLEKFGACEIPRSEYLEQLAKAVEMKTSFLE
jgi:leucyl/phenylalanyl-tRNA--protein transferase